MGIWELDLRSGASKHNLLHDRIFGYETPQSSWSPEIFLTHVHPEDLGAVLKQIQIGEATGDVYFENRIVWPDKSVHWIRTKGKVFRDNAGKPIRKTGTVIDITEQRETEEKLKEASRYTRSLIESSVDPLVTISPEGKITDVNAATEAVTGLARDRLIGSDFSDYFTEPERARMGYEAVFANGFVRDFPLAIRHTSGKTTQVLYNATVFKNREGRVEGVFAAARDVSERKILEEQLLQAQKLEAVGKLAGGVAHDFNNIMAIVLGYAELIKQDLPANDPIQDSVDCIRTAADRATQVTRQLLAFSRKQIMKPKVININTLITELSKMLARLIGENVEIALSLAPDLAPVKADPTQIEQVLMNLAVNARDAMPGGGNLTIATSNISLDRNYLETDESVVPGKYVMLSVKDTGKGMDEHTRSRAFEPFFSTKGKEGTGLGLSIVYGIVKQSGGYIRVHSEPGYGTTFRIYLPSVEAPVESEIVLERIPAPERGVGTILVVEDEEALAKIVRVSLEKNGYTVLSAASAEEALKMAVDCLTSIDLLLTDVILRGQMDGFKLAAQFRSVRPNSKVIYMSGYSDALNSGRNPMEPDAILLEKPFTTRKLRSIIGEVLKEKVT